MLLLDTPAGLEAKPEKDSFICFLLEVPIDSSMNLYAFFASFTEVALSKAFKNIIDRKIQSGENHYGYLFGQ